MALSTYADLQASVAGWLHRTDLNAIIPDFITLAESRINRVLRLNNSETEAALTATIGSRFIAIPSGMVEIESLWLTTYAPRQQLVYKDPVSLNLNIGPGMPRYWTIDGANIALDCIPDTAYSFTLRTYQALGLAAFGTNWLMTNHPDVYLYATLIEAAAYLRDMDMLMTWKAAYDLAIQDVQNKESRAESLSTLFVDQGMRTHTANGAIFAG